MTVFTWVLIIFVIDGAWTYFTNRAKMKHEEKMALIAKMKKPDNKN